MDETQRALLEIWSSVLRKADLRVDDDFLEVGGDSLAAMRCINRITERFGVELPLDIFFEEPANIAAMAAQVDRLRADGR
jgi:acyl carrier protein